MSYKIIVEFERELSDDAGVIGCDNPTDQQLIKQLAIELQEAYDELGLAGQFQCVRVER